MTAAPHPDRPPARRSDDDDVPPALVAHVAGGVAAWPPASPPRVVADPRRAAPGWDGAVRPVAGVVAPDGRAVVTVPPGTHVPDGLALEELVARLPALVGTPSGRTVRAVLRWSVDPAPLEDAGVWLPVTDPRVPPWLHPFGGEVLVALDAGRYVAGVGLKVHDEHVREIAVVTDEAARGRGLARRLVAQAARRVLADGALPTYLHAASNEASARVAEASGFADDGWQIVGVFTGTPG